MLEVVPLNMRWRFKLFKLSLQKFLPAISQTTNKQSSLFLSFLPSFFLHLLDDKNKLREYWLPRTSDKLIVALILTLQVIRSR